LLLQRGGAYFGRERGRGNEEGGGGGFSALGQERGEGFLQFPFHTEKGGKTEIRREDPVFNRLTKDRRRGGEGHFQGFRKRFYAFVQGGGKGGAGCTEQGQSTYPIKWRGGMRPQ